MVAKLFCARQCHSSGHIAPHHKRKGNILFASHLTDCNLLILEYQGMSIAYDLDSYELNVLQE
jgi:hypothetical protein